MSNGTGVPFDVFYMGDIMKLWRITFTGADNNTSQEEMLRISQQFKIVEWGILFGTRYKERYPTQEWIDQLPQEMALSAHLCGKYVSDAMLGNFPILNKFQRIQLNLSKKNLTKVLECEPLMEAIQQVRQKVILGGNFTGIQIKPSSNYQILYDASGGNGLSPKEWPLPVENVEVGYAGGLNSENLANELERIAEVAGDRHIWIDMESGVRTDNCFDLKKVEQCLEIATTF